MFELFLDHFLSIFHSWLQHMKELNLELERTFWWKQLQSQQVHGEFYDPFDMTEKVSKLYNLFFQFFWYFNLYGIISYLGRSLQQIKCDVGEKGDLGIVAEVFFQLILIIIWTLSKFETYYFLIFFFLYGVEVGHSLLDSTSKIAILASKKLYTIVKQNLKRDLGWLLVKSYYLITVGQHRLILDYCRYLIHLC